MRELVRLLPHLTPLPHPSGGVQLGGPPGRHELLRDLTGAQRQYLLALGAPRSLAGELAAVREAGISPEEHAELITRLRGLRALQEITDPPWARELAGDRRDRLREVARAVHAAGGPAGLETARRREAATVQVMTGTPWGDPPREGFTEALVRALRAAGVGQVLAPSQAHRWWRRLTGTGHPGSLDLVVVTQRDLCEAAGLRALVEAGVPHLPVLLTPGAVVVGPVVHPGGACTECCALHERPGDGPVTLPLADLEHWGGRQPPPALQEAALQHGVALATAWLDAPGSAVGSPRWLHRVGDPLPQAGPTAPHPSCWCAGRVRRRQGASGVGLVTASGG